MCKKFFGIWYLKRLLFEVSFEVLGKRYWLQLFGK